MDAIDVDAKRPTACSDVLTLPDSRLPMPTQRLDSCNRARRRRAGPLRYDAFAARLFVFGFTALLAGYGIWEMASVVGQEATPLQWVLVALFALTFVWVALAAANALLGFGILIWGRRPADTGDACAPLRGRTAVVMPVYNEDARQTARALRGMANEICAAGQGDSFDIFILSDSTDAEAGCEEEAEARALGEEFQGRIDIWYRRRARNVGRKAGNIADFLSRWGGAYEFMIVLDADSYMTADAMTALVRAMAEDPRAGLIQTAPRCAGRHTLFARMQQFATGVYGPVIAAGLAAWHGRDGNYWGHNAILRVRAFAACCGLPVLQGRKPFGGHILSHDFVEAALLRRGGWDVYMLPLIDGSYEQVPPSLIDSALRDRRWTQGNFQHAKVLSSAGLHPISRFHLVNGIMSYLASPLWLAFLLTGLVLALQGGLTSPDYFPHEHALFPTWPRFDSDRALSLMGYAAVVLLAPKLLGLAAALADPMLRRGAGGAGALTTSAVLETVIMALLAPVTMLIQTRFVAEVLLGRDSGWQAQRRGDDADALWAVTRRFAMHTGVGVALMTALWALSTPLLLWLLPVWLGLCLAIPLAYITALRSVGHGARRWGLFLIPEEARYVERRAARPLRSRSAVAWRRRWAHGVR